MKNAVVMIQARDSDKAYRVSYSDLYDSFEVNYQINTSYEISFTLTYTKQFADVFDACKPKAKVFWNGQYYIVQQAEAEINGQGLLTKKITADHQLLDKMRNVRIDEPEPTEDNPDVSGSGTDNSTPDNKEGIVVKKTDEQKYYTINDRLDKFFNNNDQGIKYELHGNFAEIAVDCKDSLFEWINSHIKDFGAYYIPDGDVLKIYDLANLQRETGSQFRYLNNVNENDVQLDIKAIVNDCMVYGGKMEKDITTSGGSGGGGNLDNVEAFCKSAINADFGVNKQQMINDFAARSQRVRAWGVDVNRLYDTVKNAGVSPEWFFAYELQEQGTGYGWLNHTYRHGDAYQDAASVCEWIKSTSQSNSINPAWSAPEGSMSPNPSLAAKWNQEFGKGSIGRVYLQGTAAAVWDLAGVTPNPAIGKPITGCVNQIRNWGGHTVSSNTWGWPFPSVGEGTFTAEQKFGSGSGWIRPGSSSDFHSGLDFGSVDHPGSEVHAIHGGTCIISRVWGKGGINWYCVIQDSTGLNVEYQEAFGSANNIIINVGDKIQTGQVIGYRTTNHLHIGITRHGFPEAFSHWATDDGTWIDPLATIKNGIASGGTTESGRNSSNTTRETYYALHFHYENQDSIHKYGRYKGKNVVMGSIYDMDQLKKYADATIPHDPPTSITMKNIFGDDFHLGDKFLAVVPEMNIDYQVTLFGIKGNPIKEHKDEFELTFNNTGLAMKNVINALYEDIRGINNSFSQINVFGATGGRSENGFGNTTVNRGDVRLNDKQLSALKEFTNS